MQQKPLPGPLNLQVNTRSGAGGLSGTIAELSCASANERLEFMGAVVQVLVVALRGNPGARLALHKALVSGMEEGAQGDERGGERRGSLGLEGERDEESEAVAVSCLLDLAAEVYRGGGGGGGGGGGLS